MAFKVYRPPEKLPKTKYGSRKAELVEMFNQLLYRPDLVALSNVRQTDLYIYAMTLGFLIETRKVNDSQTEVRVLGRQEPKGWAKKTPRNRV